MGGDHKCPVCQATFTRPQHVARHMRSHTGDRPYKCQYCGDQFARSDLLSRHVNKCHSNEKPLPSTGTRRKGSASASRATTSKQACDQCVQSSLPCDGCNPCSKCVQRKCRCTYVKFHRQTAPAGPGHNPRPPVPTATGGLLPGGPSSSRVPMFPHSSEDDFILGPPPLSSTGVPTMAETLYNSNSFSFPPLYPAGSMGGPSGSAPADTDPSDYAAKYRAQAQAELFGPGRSGLATGLTPLYDPRTAPSTASTASASSGSGGWMDWDQQQQAEGAGGGYHHPRPPHHESHGHGRHPDPGGAPASSTMHDKLLGHHLQHQQQHPHPNPHPYINMSMPYPLPSGPYGTSANSDRGGSTNGDTDIDLLSHNNEYEYDYDYGTRDYDYEYSGSDGDGSQSVPSSATSSSVHLPMGVSVYQQHPLQHQLQQQQQQQRQQHAQAQAQPPSQAQGMYGTGAGYNIGLSHPDRAASASTSTTSSSSSHQPHARGPSGSYGGGTGYAQQPQDERQGTVAYYHYGGPFASD